MTNNLTEGSLPKKILTFSLPLIFSNILQALFNMSDIAVVGRFSGPEALGSVGSTAILVSLFIGILMGVGNGVNVIAARYFGAKEYKSLRETVHTSAIISVIEGVIVLVIGIVFSPLLLKIMNTKENLIDGAILYLRIYFLGMPALALYNFGNGVYSAIGNTKKPLFILSFCGVLNVILNMFFVIVLHMSVDGVALASIITEYLSAVMITVSLFRTNEVYGMNFSELKITPEKARSVIGIAIPSGLQNAIFQIANLFIQTSVNSFDAVTVEGNSAATNADAFIYDVMAAFYTACSSFMSQNFGAGKKERILKSYFISLAYSFGIGALIGLLLVANGMSFLSLFTTEQAVAAAGMHRLRVMGYSYGFSAFMDCTIAASRGLGKSVVPTFIVIMGSCVFRIIWIYTVFAHYRTIESIYLLYIFSWSITAIFEIIYFAIIYKKQMRLICVKD